MIEQRPNFTANSLMEPGGVSNLLEYSSLEPFRSRICREEINMQLKLCVVAIYLEPFVGGKNQQDQTILQFAPTSLSCHHRSQS